MENIGPGSQVEDFEEVSTLFDRRREDRLWNMNEYRTGQ